jgi:hypothetical protein
MNWIKKFIPAYIEVRSLYWVQYNQEMDRKLAFIFECIDKEWYEFAEVAIKDFDMQYNQSTVPNWVAENMAVIHKAKSMYLFMTNKSID